MRTLTILLLAAAPLAAQAGKTQNIILVTADGLRWQEVFRGIDPMLMREKDAGMEKGERLRQQLWADSPEQRREKLLPFFWKTLAAGGVVLGNRDKSSAVQVSNAFRVSYPGYSEILTCRAQDEQIRNNDPIRNPRLTVLEFARQKLGIGPSQAALLASWERFRLIGESREGAVFINAGYQDAAGSPRVVDLSRMQFDVRGNSDESRHDYVTFELALEHLRLHRPRLLYVAFDETDEWAHSKRYDRTLQSAQYFDRSLARLWQAAQSVDQYRGRTTLLVTSDHGRGSKLDDWSRHGAKVEGAEYIWMAALGPDTPARGEAGGAATVYQRDVAATILALLGLDWREYCGAGGGQPVAAIAGPGR